MLRTETIPALTVLLPYDSTTVLLLIQKLPEATTTREWSNDDRRSSLKYDVELVFPIVAVSAIEGGYPQVTI